MSQNYVLKPKRNSKSCVSLCIGLLILSAVSFYLSEQTALFRAIGQLISVILLLLFIQITTKFLLTEYEYAIEGETVHFSCRQGRKIKQLGSIILSDRCRLMSKKEFAEQKKKLSISYRLSFCQNLFAPEATVLLCPDEKGCVAVCFEPDEVFLNLLKECIGKG